ncbi:single-stranded DNA-binding protein [Rothia sp. P5764]|uniref:single-stranded DNA-binding protein n=1 Tax=Rothia sp. P5764 TaxID=3402654 RepID=UPI003AD315C1
MNNEIPLTIVGNLARNPELRFFKDGAAVTYMTVAHTPRVWSAADKDYVPGITTYLDVEVRSKGSEKQNDYVQRISEELQKGDRLIATGILITKERKRDGETIRSMSLLADEIAPSNRFVSVTINRKPKPAQGTVEAHPSTLES